MIEPSIAGLVGVVPDVATVWGQYRKCGICRAEAGQPCTALYGRIAGGQREGAQTVLNLAHGSRKLVRGVR